MLFTYNEHRLLGEYTLTDTTVQETVWLGDLPVATVQGEVIYAIHTDHLGTPRVITDASNTEVWTWNSDPFGRAEADEDPDGDGIKLAYNLRFPGQYYDAETGTHYNYFRDYDPGTGRYIQSDPVGLGGGLNTYSYVSANPLNNIDPIGLVEWTGSIKVTDIGVVLGGANILANFTSECIDGEQYKVDIEAIVGGIDIGFLPFGLSQSPSETIDDGLSYIDPYALEGSAGFGTVGATISVGGGVSHYRFGKAQTPGDKVNAGVNYGLAEGVMAMTGRSSIIGEPQRIECGCAQ